MVLLIEEEEGKDAGDGPLGGGGGPLGGGRSGLLFLLAACPPLLNDRLWTQVKISK